MSQRPLKRKHASTPTSSPSYCWDDNVEQQHTIDDIEEVQCSKRMCRRPPSHVEFFCYGYDGVWDNIFHYIGGSYKCFGNGCAHYLSLLLVNRYMHEMLVLNDEFRMWRLVSIENEGLTQAKYLPGKSFIESERGKYLAQFLRQLSISGQRKLTIGLNQHSAVELLKYYPWNVDQALLLPDEAIRSLAMRCRRILDLLATYQDDQIQELSDLLGESTAYILSGYGRCAFEDLEGNQWCNTIAMQCSHRLELLQSKKKLHTAPKNLVIAAAIHSSAHLENSVFAEDPEVLRRIVNNGNPWAIAHAHESIKRNRDITMLALQREGKVLEFLPESFRRDRSIVCHAAKHNTAALGFADKSVLRDRELFQYLVHYDGLAMKYALAELKSDREIMMIAVGQNGMALEYASEELKDDKDIVLKAVCNEGWALHHASDRLKSDRDVVLAAVAKAVSALQFASTTMQAQISNDREVALSAVSQNGLVLRRLSKHLQNYKDIVLEAVRRNGLALEYASPELKDDVEVVSVALNQNVKAIEHVSGRLKQIFAIPNRCK